MSDRTPNPEFDHTVQRWASEAEQSAHRSLERRREPKVRTPLWVRTVMIALACAIIVSCILLIVHWPS